MKRLIATLAGIFFATVATAQWKQLPNGWQPMDGSQTTVSPPGTVSPVTFGADPTGVLDSTTAVAAAIDKVLNNNSQYKTVYYPCNSVIRQDHQIQRLGIASTITLNIVGCGSALIDATNSVDTAIFDLEGGTVASTTLASLVTAGDSTITLTAGGVAALGLVAGDKMMLTTGNYADARLASCTWTAASANLTLCSGNSAWLVGDKIGTGQTSCFPIGTTIASTPTAATVGLSAPAFAGCSGSGQAFNNDPLILFDLNRESYYKGEILEVPLSTEVTAPAPINGQIITLKRTAQDTYQTASTTVYKIKVPTITIDGVNFKRNGNASTMGYEIQYATATIRNCTGQGARDRLFYLNYIYGGSVESNYGFDFWYSGTGTSYGLALTSSQDVIVRGNRFFSGRHGITLGGTWPVRNVQVLGNNLENVDASAPSFDMHEDVEKIIVEGNIFNNGAAVSGKQITFIGNHVYPSPSDKFTITGTTGYLNIIGNSFYQQGTRDCLVINYQLPGNSTTDTLNISNNVLRCGGKGIYFLPNSANATLLTINKTTFDNNDVRAGLGYASGSASCGQSALVLSNGGTTAYIRFKKMEIAGGRYSSFSCDGTSIAVDSGSQDLSVTDAEFTQGRQDGTPWVETTAQSFVDETFTNVKSTVSDSGLQTRANSFFATGTLKLKGWIYDHNYNSTNCGNGWRATGNTQGTNTPRVIISTDAQYTSVCTGTNTFGDATTYVSDYRTLPVRPQAGTVPTVEAVGDWAAGANWGTTKTISAVGAMSTDTNGSVTVSATGTGQAVGGTLTLTFHRPFAIAPVMDVTWANGTLGAATRTQTTPDFTWTTSTTQLVITFNSVPVAANTYQFSYQQVR